MICFVKSPAFAEMNVGFPMDEGIASPDETFNLYYGERAGGRKSPTLIKYDICPVQIQKNKKQPKMAIPDY